MVKMMKDGTWVSVRRVHVFHEGIGFVPIKSLRVSKDGQWKVVPLECQFQDEWSQAWTEQPVFG